MARSTATTLAVFAVALGASGTLTACGAPDQIAPAAAASPDPENCPWTTTSEVAAALHHSIATLTVTAGNGVPTCLFTWAPEAGSGAVLYDDVSFAAVPGVDSDYFNRFLSGNHVVGAVPVDGVGREAVAAGDTLYVLTANGIAVITCERPGGDGRADDIALFRVLVDKF